MQKTTSVACGYAISPITAKIPIKLCLESGCDLSGKIIVQHSKTAERD